MMLSKTGIRLILAVASLFAFSQQAQAQVLTRKLAQPRPDVMLAPAEMDWAPAPDLFPRGAEISLLEGDPSLPGPFTIRLRFPKGYHLPAHRHITTERLTVISGVLLLGSGKSSDRQKTKTLEAGSFATMSANNYHYAFAEELTVVQLHGRGPLQIMYADPAEDPRKKQPAAREDPGLDKDPFSAALAPPVSPVQMTVRVFPLSPGALP